MKKCSYCGLENPDAATQCATCHTDLHPPAPELKPMPVMSAAEKRVWERMSFRQFAILFVRLQALWLLLYAVLYMTYLPPYFAKLHEASASSYYNPEVRRSLFLAFLRIILHVAAALAVMQCAERIVSWFVRDWVEAESLDKKEGQ